MEEHQEIQCAICQKANPDFEAITRQINQARTPADKAYFAKQLIEKAGAVLNEHKASGDVLTEACRTVLKLRKQTAELVLKFQK